MYSLQNMLAIDDEATVYVETFRIPSACVCELVNKGGGNSTDFLLTRVLVPSGPSFGQCQVEKVIVRAREMRSCVGQFSFFLPPLSSSLACPHCQAAQQQN